MNTPVVTFLVPCYNVSSCVQHCLDSLLAIPEINDKIEILAINDGSLDTTLDILNNYQAQYPSIVRLINKKNGGWGTVINLGIREAKGKYLKEIDADDWVESSNLVPYIEALEQFEDCDFVATEYKDYMKTTDSYTPHTYPSQCYNQVLSIGEFWSNYPDNWNFPIHTITYNTAFLKKINLTIGDRYYTDIEYDIFPLPYIKKLVVLPLNITVYFHGSEEQSTGLLGYRKHYKNYLELSQKLVHFSHNLPDNTIQPVRDYIHTKVQRVINFSYKLLLSPVYVGDMKNIENERREYDHWIKINAPEHYEATNKLYTKKIPYVKIWRNFHINIYNLAKIKMR